MDDRQNIYIPDYDHQSILSYSADGTMRGSLGRGGRGPGEFQRIAYLFMHGDRLGAYGLNLRIILFSTETFESTESIVFDTRAASDSDEVTSPRPHRFFSFNDDEYIVSLNIQNLSGDDRNYRGYYRMNREGKIISPKLFETVMRASHSFSGGSYSLPFTDEGMIDVSPEGTVYKANTSDFLIQVLDDSATGIARSIYVPYENASLDRDRFLQGYDDFLRSRLRNADFPATWPALNGFIVDDEERIWVSTITENQDTYDWWVLDNQGSLLARFQWPRSEVILKVRDGYLYVASGANTLGTLDLSRYKIQLNNDI
ncbi:MAG: hypothetical protein U5K31_15100 [Balneolaceae bacterium]|nr:hypothetical protein [Balneolaceae bacterium]